MYDNWYVITAAAADMLEALKIIGKNPGGEGSGWWYRLTPYGRKKSVDGRMTAAQQVTGHFGVRFVRNLGKEATGVDLNEKWVRNADPYFDFQQSISDIKLEMLELEKMFFQDKITVRELNELKYMLEAIREILKTTRSILAAKSSEPTKESSKYQEYKERALRELENLKHLSGLLEKDVKKDDLPHALLADFAWLPKQLHMILLMGCRLVRIVST